MAHLVSAARWPNVTDIDRSAPPVGAKRLRPSGLGAARPALSQAGPSRQATAQSRQLPHLRRVCLASLRAERPQGWRVACCMDQTVRPGSRQCGAGHGGDHMRPRPTRRLARPSAGRLTYSGSCSSSPMSGVLCGPRRRRRCRRPGGGRRGIAHHPPDSGDDRAEKDDDGALAKGRPANAESP